MASGSFSKLFTLKSKIVNDLHDVIESASVERAEWIDKIEKLIIEISQFLKHANIFTLTISCQI